MKKRKRDGGANSNSLPLSSKSDSVSGKKSPVFSSNWLQLQETLQKRQGGKNPRKYAKSGGPTATDEAKEVRGKAEGSAGCLLPTSSDCSLTKIVALDCEMVGVGPEGKKNALARVSIVNMWGNVVYDKYVRPPDYITDFRTKVSGVRSRDLRKGHFSLKALISDIVFWPAQDFPTTQKEVSDMLNNRILVGHALRNDLKVLLLSHPRKNIRDTQRYGPYKSLTGGLQSLKHLAFTHLKASIQQGEHDSVEDARAALCLYQHSKEAWEKSLRQIRKVA